MRPSIRPNVRRARRLAAELLSTAHAVAVLVAVEALIRWVPLPRLSRLLGVRLNLDPVRADVERVRPGDLPPQARRQVRCTARVTEVWPLSKGPCLRRSLVIGHLLRRHGTTVRLGIAGAGATLRAHAWVEVDGRPLEDVAGYSTFQQAPIGAAS